MTCKTVVEAFADAVEINEVVYIKPPFSKAIKTSLEDFKSLDLMSSECLAYTTAYGILSLVIA